GRRHQARRHGARVCVGRQWIRYGIESLGARRRRRKTACGGSGIRCGISCTDAAMSDGPEIVALGEPLVEFNQIHADDPHTYLQGFGGDTSNMAIAAARLGAHAGYITRVGDDAFGRMFLTLWEHEHVDTRGVTIDRAAPTGVYFV